MSAVEWQPRSEDFARAETRRGEQRIVRPSISYWQDAWRRLKRNPRAIGGRCASCHYVDVCGGNTRVRAMRLSGDAWAEDPGCYLTDMEIGLAVPSPRLIMRPYRGLGHEQQLAE